MSNTRDTALGSDFVPADLFWDLIAHIDELTDMVAELHDRSPSKPALSKPSIEPKARYHLDEAADYLGVSTSTLKRRAKARKLIILYDGKTPFVMGAELLRYAREGMRRK